MVVRLKGVIGEIPPFVIFISNAGLEAGLADIVRWAV